MKPSASTAALHAPRLIVEIRAAEGGADARELVNDQFAIYVKLGGRRGL